MCVFFFFFKQKTAYEMRISDWSSDVCSSDLIRRAAGSNGRERSPTGSARPFPPACRATKRKTASGARSTRSIHPRHYCPGDGTSPLPLPASSTIVAYGTQGGGVGSLRLTRPASNKDLQADEPRVGQESVHT